MERLDLRGLRCPLIVRLVARHALAEGPVPFDVVGDDPAMELDLRVWAERSGWLLEIEREASVIRARLLPRA